MKPTFTSLSPVERCRTYIYSDDQRISFINVTAVHVSERGTHRLELDNGTKVIIPTGFRAVILDVDDWTF
jgi:hypothetical protein